MNYYIYKCILYSSLKNISLILILMYYRRMFPAMRVKIVGLDPHQQYYIAMDIVPVDNKRYRCVYQSMYLFYFNLNLNIWFTFNYLRSNYIILYNLPYQHWWFSVSLWLQLYDDNIQLQSQKIYFVWTQSKLIMRYKMWT